MPNVDPSVFEFIDDIVVEARAGEPMRSDSAVITFGESFFDQFFGALGHNIRGFNSEGKKRAVAFVDSLPDTHAMTEIRLILVSFEEFCDLVRESQGNYDGYVVDFDEAVALLNRILIATQAWAHHLSADSAPAALSATLADAVSKIGDL
ncbi:hypothetical protein [Nocardioides caricicola]|uniref:Barstar (barnase inhibitor) domain-containing protein n=1 Tax=Nocardioides caricicola TaxID=634770 RepID=A0ABW0MZI0_9ACTN